MYNFLFYLSHVLLHELVVGGAVGGFEEELAKDVLEIITVFSARLYGSRSNKNKKLLEDVQQAVENNVKK